MESRDAEHPVHVYTGQDQFCQHITEYNVTTPTGIIAAEGVGACEGSTHLEEYEGQDTTTAYWLKEIGILTVVSYRERAL